MASPATTGSTPQARSRPQTTMPSTTNTERRCSRNRTATSISTYTAAATTSGMTTILSLYTNAITSRAPRSSTTNTVSTNTRIRSGTSRPNRASRPRASAVSVDMATPQPWALGRPALKAR